MQREKDTCVNALFCLLRTLLALGQRPESHALHFFSVVGDLGVPIRAYY
jgi:coenzyme F420-reducing hydrogenase alpha subunit